MVSTLLEKHNITITVVTAVTVFLFVIWGSFAGWEIYASMNNDMSAIRNKCGTTLEKVIVLENKYNDVNIKLAEIAKDLQYIRLKIDE